MDNKLNLYDKVRISYDENHETVGYVNEIGTEIKTGKKHYYVRIPTKFSSFGRIEVFTDQDIGITIVKD